MTTQERLLTALVTSAVLALTACNAPTTGVQPGDGPAHEPPAVSMTAPPSGTVEGSGETESPVPDNLPVANFTEKYVYPDGVEVEVIKVTTGRVSADEAEYNGSVAAGDPWVTLSIRVKNGSTTKITDAYGSGTLSYGPDGKSAESMYTEASSRGSAISGVILPGRSKVQDLTYALAPKYQSPANNPPVLEFMFDLEHDAAVFSGPLR